GGRRTECYDCPRLHAHDLSSNVVERFSPTIAETLLEREAPTLDVPQIAEALLERVECRARGAIGARIESKEHHAVALRRLLCRGGKRRGQDGSEGRHECAAVHPHTSGFRDGRPEDGRGQGTAAE